MKNKQFEEWHSNSKYKAVNFMYLPFAYQWGVYLEFFDSVGIYICSGEFINEFKIFTNSIVEEQFTNFKSRQEAQQEAIKKAFELLPT